MIYFIQQCDGGPIKIGYAVNVESRLTSLQTAASGRLVVLGVCDGSISYERTLHARFHLKRVSGEWFQDCAEIREFISTFCEKFAPSEPEIVTPVASTFAGEVLQTIREILCASDLTARQISAVTGVTPKSVENWRQGINSPNAASLLLLARVIPELKRKVLEWLDADSGDSGEDPQRLAQEIAQFIIDRGRKSA